MKRVLIITPLFPPGGGPGAKRVSQFVRYLDKLGWEPIVLTHRYHPLGIDEGSLKLVPPGIKIFRTYSLEPYIMKSDVVGTSTKDLKFKNYSGKRLIQHLKSWFGVMDTGVLWLPFAVSKAIVEFPRCRFDSIFVTGPPFSSHLIGLIVKKLTGCPLTLDFRDAWASNPEVKALPPGKFSFQKALERMVVRNADNIIANTPGVQKDFVDRYPNEPDSKFHVIPNGFDPAEKIWIKSDGIGLDRTKFNLVHTGTLGGLRDPVNFLTALHELLQEKRIPPESIRVHFVGNMKKFKDGRTISDYIEALNLKEQVNLTGFIPREKAFAYNTEADVLLLIIGVMPQSHLQTYGLSGKIYDYLLTGKPILALAQKGGATFELLNKHGIGTISNPIEINDIKEKLAQLYTCWKTGDLEPNYTIDTLDSYNMEHLTRRLSALLMPTKCGTMSLALED